MTEPVPRASSNDEGFAPQGAGRRIITWSWIGTAAFTVAAVAAAVVPDPLVIVSVPVALAMLVVGVVAFVAAYARAVERSRTVEIGIGGWFFLAGTAPSTVRRHLMGALALQVVVAFATAGVRVFTPLAFNVLAPMYGLGLAGLWGARYGRFSPRIRPGNGSGVRQSPVMDQNAGHG
ncbi:MAG: hypothetical protein AB7L13_07000 [Acidimicrobiia bacterium]